MGQAIEGAEEYGVISMATGLFSLQAVTDRGKTGLDEKGDEMVSYFRGRFRSDDNLG